MNVNALLVDTLDSLLPTADSVYKGAATEYIVFNYTELPADFADDDAAHYRYYNSMLDVLDLAYMTVNHEKIPPNVLKEWVKLITDELSQISKIKRSDKARA